MSKIAPLSGFPEWLPAQRIVELSVLDRIRHTFELYGFASLETRAVEPLDQLLRKGETSKEVYVVRRLQGDHAQGDEVGLGLHFDLTGIPLQGGPGCPATPSCVEGPFILTQTATGIRIDFDVFGKFVNGADSGDYVGSFGVTMDGLTLNEAGLRLTGTGADLACDLNNSTAPCSFTANFNPFAVPEPATLLTFGAGSVLLARLRRRKKEQ